MSDGPVVSPRRAAAAAWFSVLATLLWARLGLAGFEDGWTAVLLGVFALVAFSLPIALRQSTRDVGTGICVGAVAGLVLAALVDVVV